MPRSKGRKCLKHLSKLILDFGLAKGKSTVEFREELWRLNGESLFVRHRQEVDAVPSRRRLREGVQPRPPAILPWQSRC
jgi:hypothetical protein